MHTTFGISAAANYDRGAIAGARIAPAEAVLTILDESIKRLDAATEALADKLEPLNGDRPVPDGNAVGQAEPYQHVSTLMTSLEDRARHLDAIATRLSRICARTEL